MAIDKFTLNFKTPFGDVSTAPMTLGPSGKQPISDKLAVIISDFDKAYETSNLPEAARCLSELCKLVKPSQALEAQTVVRGMRVDLQRRQFSPFRRTKQRRLFEQSRVCAYALRELILEEIARPAPKYRYEYTRGTGKATPLAVDRTSLLQMDQVSFRYSDREILRDVNIVVRPGEVVGVFGENGSGKSTLLRGMAGDISPSSGSVYYPRLDAASNSRSEKFGRIAYVDMRGGAATDASISVIRYLRFYAALRGTARNAEADADEVVSRLVRVGLEHRQDVDIGHLSAGETARLEFAKMLVSPPQLLLLDEPLAPLDAAGKRTLAIELVELIRNGDLPSALVMTTQDDLILELMSSRILLIHDGLVEDATPREERSVWYEIGFRNAGEALGKIKEFLDTVGASKYEIDGVPMRFCTEGKASMSSISEAATRLSLDMVYLRDLSTSPSLSEPRKGV